MAVATWKGIGAYVNYRSDFRKNEYSYTCTSDGDTEYGRIWTTGKSRADRTMITAGLAMFTSRRFGFFAGAGVTSYTRCWEDVSGQWAKVEDKSFKSPAADVGLFLTFRPLILSVGVTSDFSGHADLQFAVGVFFLEVSFFATFLGIFVPQELQRPLFGDENRLCRHRRIPSQSVFR